MGQHTRPPWPARCYLWATERLYHELAWAYDAVSWLVSLGRWSAWRRGALAHVRGPRVLEIGFGTGELLLEMAARGHRVCGLDPSPEMQRVAGRKLRRRGAHVPRLRGYAQALPFATGSLDTIVSTFPAGYILAPETWREAARALRRPDPRTGAPGGRLIIAGLYVEAPRTPLDAVARLLHSGPGQGAVARCERLATEAGLALTVSRGPGEGPQAPVLIAEHTPGL